jgi:hypothetical protein
MIVCCGSPPARAIVASNARIGLAELKRVLPADGAEARGQTKLRQQVKGGMLELVRADGECPSRRFEPVERRFNAGKGAALVGDMRLVTSEKREKHFLQPRRRHAAACRRQASLDQRARPRTNH